MLPEAVDRMITDYKRNQARAGHLKAEIKRLTKHIAQVEEDELGLNATVNDGMPHGSKVGDPTGMKGIALANGRIVCDEERKDLKAAQDELDHLEIEHMFVSSWLKALTERERFVIEKQMISGVSWKVVEGRFKIQFGDSCSKDTMRRIKAQSLTKIYLIAG